MVAEESGMKISAIGATIEPENPLPARPGAKIALAVDSKDNHQMVAEASPAAFRPRAGPLNIACQPRRCTW